MPSSYHSKVRDLLKTRQSCFSFVWDMNFSIIFPCLSEAKVSTANSDLTNFVDVNVCMETLMNYAFLTRFSHTLFTKSLLLFHISSLKRLIYRGVNTSKILHGAKSPLHLPRIRSRQYLFISSTRKLPSSNYAQKKNLATRKIMLT